MLDKLYNKPIVNVIKYEDKYLSDTIDVLGYIWKTLDFDQRSKLFNWRYLDNPYLGENFVFIALVEDKVIGIAPYVVLKFQFGSEVRHILSAADTVIHPDYQGVGAYGKMANFAMDYVWDNRAKLKIACYLNLSSNHLSTPMCIKLGWSKLLPRDYLFRISLSGFIKQMLKLRRNTPGKVKDQYRFESDINPRIDEMVGVKDMLKSPIRSVRDKEFYSWHYGNGDYRFIYVYKGSELSAYLVLQKSSKYQYMVLEWVTDSPTSMVNAFRYAAACLAIPITRLYFMNLNHTEREVLRVSGFRPLPSMLARLRNTNRYPALIRPLDLNMDREQVKINGLDPMLADNWSIMRIDVY